MPCRAHANIHDLPLPAPKITTPVGEYMFKNSLGTTSANSHGNTLFWYVSCSVAVMHIFASAEASRHKAKSTLNEAAQGSQTKQKRTNAAPTKLKKSAPQMWTIRTWHTTDTTGHTPRHWSTKIWQSVEENLFTIISWFIIKRSILICIYQNSGHSLVFGTLFAVYC